MFEEFSSAHDTEISSSRLQIRRLAEMTASERMQRFFSHFSASRAFVSAGLHLRYPDSSDEELKKRHAAIFLGRDYALRVYQWDPQIEGY